jgi:hypothetical protein
MRVVAVPYVEEVGLVSKSEEIASKDGRQLLRNETKTTELFLQSDLVGSDWSKSTSELY